MLHMRINYIFITFLLSICCRKVFKPKVVFWYSKEEAYLQKRKKKNIWEKKFFLALSMTCHLFNMEHFSSLLILLNRAFSALFFCPCWRQWQTFLRTLRMESSVYLLMFFKKLFLQPIPTNLSLIVQLLMFMLKPKSLLPDLCQT